jgi:hypothetical protein
MLAKSYSASKGSKENNGTVSQYDNNLVQIETLHLMMRPLIKMTKAVQAAEAGQAAGNSKKKKKAQVEHSASHK